MARGVTKRRYKLPETDEAEQSMDERYEYAKQQEEHAQRRNRITRSASLQEERYTETGRLSEERWMYNMILRWCVRWQCT